MKLDKEVIAEIVRSVHDHLYMMHGSEFMEDRFIRALCDLNLVFKPGDSSQSVLVEQK